MYPVNWNKPEVAFPVPVLPDPAESGAGAAKIY